MCKITFSGNLQFAFYTLQEGGFSYTHIVYTQRETTSTHPAWAHQRAANIDVDSSLLLLRFIASYYIHHLLVKAHRKVVVTCTWLSILPCYRCSTKYISIVPSLKQRSAYYSWWTVIFGGPHLPTD